MRKLRVIGTSRSTDAARDGMQAYALPDRAEEIGRHPMSGSQKSNKQDRGAALVEFALVLPVVAYSSSARSTSLAGIGSASDSRLRLEEGAGFPRRIRMMWPCPPPPAYTDLTDKVDAKTRYSKNHAGFQVIASSRHRAANFVVYSPCDSQFPATDVKAGDRVQSTSRQPSAFSPHWYEMSLGTRLP